MYAIISPNGSVNSVQFTAAITSKGCRCLPLTDIKPVPALDEMLIGPEIYVDADGVRRVWRVRPKTYAEKLAEVHAARAAAYPPLGDQLDAAFKARIGDGSELAALDAAIQAVKAAHPKPAA